ncbi:MAG TPA: hypothetical protein VL401_01115 [Alphaproteobacteria bacterium]|jgi:hypothetical protein|nr:hypothetical protein [Alphaproteobacteria bacterium]
MFKKLAPFLIFSFLIINSLALPMAAQAAPTDPKKPAATPTAPVEGNWYNQDFGQWYGKVYDTDHPEEIFGERYTAAQVQWVVYSLFSFILNSTTNANVLSCILKNSTDLKACASVISSATTSISQPAQAVIPQVENKSLISLVFDTNRPFSGISYVKEKVKKFDLVPTAQAAPVVGFGFNALLPVQSMWRASRDIAFGLFVIVAIVFAFMIMFRVKISPQVVISVQSAIPKIIISLILVTFSYAIAGFLVDLMYVVIGVISLIFAGFLPVHDPHITSGIFNFLTVGQPFGGDVPIGVFGLLIVYMLVFPFVLVILIFYTIGLVGSAIAGLLTIAGLAVLFSPPLAAISLIIGAILLIVIIITLLLYFIKVIWTLLKAFVNILLLVIFAPLQIVAGVFVPNFGFGAWVKNLVSNLAVFVVTGVLILLSYIFLYQGFNLGAAGVFDSGLINALFKLLFGSFVGGLSPIPTPDSAAWPPLLGGSGSTATGLLFVGASFVIFTLIPKTADAIQAFMAGKPFAYGNAIGETFGPAKMGWAMTAGAVIGGTQKTIGENVGSSFGGKIKRTFNKFKDRLNPEEVT